MDTDAMSNGKAHLLAIEHGQGLFLVFEDTLQFSGTALEDRTAAGSLDDEFWLKEKGHIARPFGHFLPVDEKQCDSPARGRAANQPFNIHVWLLFRLWFPAINRAFLEG